jgi:hypothetical protein
MQETLTTRHYRSYNKIQQQQEILEGIWKLGEKYGLSLEEDCTARFGNTLNKTLEELVKQGDIEPLLKEQASLIECKYAYSTGKLLEYSPENLSLLKSVLKKQGMLLAVVLKEYYLDAAGIFKAIADNLPDGNSELIPWNVLKQNENQVIWTRNVCAGNPCWETAGIENHIYYELQEAWMEGLVSELGYIFEIAGRDTYQINTYDRI